MAVTIDMTGKWRGVLYYSAEYNAGDASLRFEMEIKQTGQAIEGIATDTGGWGMSPDPASIVGKLKGHKLQFIKQYVSTHYVVNGQVYVDDTVLGPEITYTGVYDDTRKVFEGKWAFLEKRKWMGLLPYTVSAGSGTWQIWRYGE